MNSHCFEINRKISDTELGVCSRNQNLWTASKFILDIQTHMPTFQQKPHYSCPVAWQGTAGAAGGCAIFSMKTATLHFHLWHYFQNGTLTFLSKPTDIYHNIHVCVNSDFHETLHECHATRDYPTFRLSNSLLLSIGLKRHPCILLRWEQLLNIWFQNSACS